MDFSRFDTDERNTSTDEVFQLTPDHGLHETHVSTLSLILRLVIVTIILIQPSPARSYEDHFDPTDAAHTSLPVILTEAEEAWLAAHPVIRVAPDPDFKPIEYFDAAGHYHGAAADMIALLANKLNIKVEPVQLANWDEVLARFKSHDVDILGAIVRTPQREEFALFTDTLISVPGGIFSAEIIADEVTLADLAGKKVAVVSNYTAHDILSENYPEIILDVVPDVATGLAKASTGKVDAYVENMANATYYSEQTGITNLKLVGYTDFEYSWCIGVRNDWPELQGILNKGLAAIGEEERRGVLHRWIRISSEAWSPSEAQLIGMFSLLLTGLLILALVWNYTLRRAITRRLTVESELKQTQSYISSIINSMPSMLVGIDTTGTVTLWNDRATENTGIQAIEARGQPVTDLLPEIAGERENIAKAIETGKTIRDRQYIRLPENGTRIEDITIYPLSLEGSRGAVIRIDDITERVRLEEMMVQGEKMLSIGGLAAGMAHEINNPLAGMIQNANNMHRRLAGVNLPANQVAAAEVGTDMETITAFMEKREIPRLLQMIEESGTRMALIVRNMLSFARKSESTISAVNLADLLDKTLELACTDYDLKKKYDFKTINIIKLYESDLPAVPCESAKIQQVLLNILRNGAHAMNTGNARREARGKQPRPPQFILRLSMEDDVRMVRLEIEDNGPGMPPGLCRRIFEPFFTTKPVGEGTGLGLSVSYFIITDNHNGTLSVVSDIDRGANFIIRLPVER